MNIQARDPASAPERANATFRCRERFPPRVTSLDSIPRGFCHASSSEATTPWTRESPGAVKHPMWQFTMRDRRQSVGGPSSWVLLVHTRRCKSVRLGFTRMEHKAQYRGPVRLPEKYEARKRQRRASGTPGRERARPQAESLFAMFSEPLKGSSIGYGTPHY